MSLFKCSDLSFIYKLGVQNIEALCDINLEIQSGEFICLAGPSGSGKSTLLNLLGLIEPVQSGHLMFEGLNLKELSESQRNHIRRFKMGFVFQNFHLINVLNCYENVEYFLARQGVAPVERKKRVLHALEQVGLLEHKKKRPLEMSGGQRQRVAIARALVKRPDVIIADEPTASLDQKTGKEIMQHLINATRDHKTTVITASHDPMVIGMASKVIKLVDGRIYAP